MSEDYCGASHECSTTAVKAVMDLNVSKMYLVSTFSAQTKTDFSLGKAFISNSAFYIKMSAKHIHLVFCTLGTKDFAVH